MSRKENVAMKIVIMDADALNPGDASWEPLEKLGEITAHEHTRPEEFASRALGADIVLVNKTTIRKHDIPALGDCRLVGVLATGANNLDLRDLANAGIAVCNVPAYGVMDVAQHALALLMELARNTASHSASIKSGDWQKIGKWCYWLKTPLSLYGLTMGIIGFGAIGQAMGALAHALGMRVATSSANPAACPPYPFTRMALDNVWKISDVISLHCPLTPATNKIINPESIAQMKDGAILINTARGGLIDEEAVAAALKSGKLGGYGADVLSSEPPMAGNPLLDAPNTLLTPHIAWATKRARQNIIDMMAANIQAFLAGKPQNVIN